jgi:hypothetical protein
MELTSKLGWLMIFPIVLMDSNSFGFLVTCFLLWDLDVSYIIVLLQRFGFHVVFNYKISHISNIHQTIDNVQCNSHKYALG